MRFSHSARLDAVAAPAAEWDMPAGTVIFDLCGGWFAGIGQDFVGCAPLIFFIDFMAIVIFRNLSVCVSSLFNSSMVIIALVAEEILQLLLIHRIQPLFGREDHLISSCWRSYARTMIG